MTGLSISKANASGTMCIMRTRCGKWALYENQQRIHRDARTGAYLISHEQRELTAYGRHDKTTMARIHGGVVKVNEAIRAMKAVHNYADAAYASGSMNEQLDGLLGCTVAAKEVMVTVAVLRETISDLLGEQTMGMLDELEAEATRMHEGALAVALGLDPIGQLAKTQREVKGG